MVTVMVVLKSEEPGHLTCEDDRTTKDLEITGSREDSEGIREL